MGAAPSEGLPVKPIKSGELRQEAAPNYDIFSYPLQGVLGSPALGWCGILALVTD